MYKLGKLLLLIALTTIVGSFYFGCEQPEDVLTTVSRTDIYLTEERLPDNPDGMIYEVWVANSSDSVSLGKFGYNFETKKYYDTQMNLKADSNKFSFNGDINQFEVLFVSVETNPDDNAASPGPIMLIDFIASPTVQLRFPNVDSLWDATVRYSMETPSDGMNPTFDGYGIWFASYNEINTAFNDTFLIGGVLDWSISYGTYVGCNDPIEANVIYGLDSITQKDTTMIFEINELISRLLKH